MTKLKISNPIVCFSITLMTLVKGIDKYIDEKLIWRCLLLSIIILAIYSWKKFHQKILILSLGFWGLSCLVGLFWQVTTPYDGMVKGALILWSAFFAVSSVLISKLKECNETDKMIVKLIVALFGGSIFLLCAIGYIIFLIKS